MATTNHYDSSGRRQLALTVERLDRRGWTFDGLRVATILERIDATDNELFARLLDATNAGDEHSGTVALYSILPRLVTNVKGATSGACRGRALDEMLGFAWIVIKEAGADIPRRRSIHLVVNRVRFRARRSVTPHRVDRPHLSDRETLHRPELFETGALTAGQELDPTADAVMRRLDIEHLGRAVTTAIEEGAIEAENWTALIDARVHGRSPQCEYRSKSGTWTAIWRTVHRVRTLADIPA